MTGWRFAKERIVGILSEGKFSDNISEVWTRNEITMTKTTASG